MNLAVVAGSGGGGDARERAPGLTRHCICGDISKACFHPTHAARRVERISQFPWNNPFLQVPSSPPQRPRVKELRHGTKGLWSSTWRKDVFLPADGWQSCACVYIWACMFACLCVAVFVFAWPALRVCHFLIFGPSASQLAATNSSQAWFHITWQRAFSPPTSILTLQREGPTTCWRFASYASLECENAPILHSAAYRSAKYLSRSHISCLPFIYSLQKRGVPFKINTLEPIKLVSDPVSDVSDAVFIGTGTK